MASKPAPKDLQAPGRALWKAVLEDFELNASELALLKESCRTADELELLRRAVLDSETMTTGSTGQPVVNKLFEEVRKHRDALAKSLAALSLPDEDADEKRDAANHARAKKGAAGRWGPAAASNVRSLKNG